MSEDYSVPRFSEDPERVFQTEREILRYLEEHPQEPYGLYFNDADPGSARQAMVFYTVDGMTIFGLADDSPDHMARLHELAAFIGAEHSLSGWEQPPPDSSSEFVELCRIASESGSLGQRTCR